MAHKTKATMSGRQCNQTNINQGQITWLTAGGQSQPFGSIPRCCNSFLMMRFIQAASESSPSCCCACSIFSLSSGSKRNWKGGLPRRSFLCVDTSITPDVMYECVITHYTHNKEKATPRSAGTLSRRLTSSDR